MIGLFVGVFTFNRLTVDAIQTFPVTVDISVSFRQYLQEYLKGD